MVITEQKTPPKSDAGRKVSGASVITLHGSTAAALANNKAKLARGELEDVAQRLSAKQESFARRVASGTCTLSDAYRASYDAEGMANKTIWQAASRLMGNSKVAARVAELSKAQEEEYLHDGASLRAFVVNGLQIEATQASSPGARVRALELLGKLTEVQAFADVSIDRTPKRTEAEIEADIKDLLERLQPQAG